MSTENLPQDLTYNLISNKSSDNEESKDDNRKLKRIQYLQVFDTKAPWLWESLAILFSFICTAIVAGFLKYQDGKNPDVWKLSIGPNSVVSIIGSFVESSYLLVIASILLHLKWRHFRQPQQLGDLRLFDESIRGPWGSLKILLLKNRSTSLASCAALVTVLSYFTDFAFQQTLNFYSGLQQNVTGAPTPMITVAPSYDPNNYLLSQVDVDPASAVNENMQASILSGLYFQVPDSDNDDIECDSFSCNWPLVATLGVCASCQNVKPNISGPCNADYPFDNGTFSYTFCNYTVPENVVLGASAEHQLGADLQYVSTLWNSTGYNFAPQQLGGLGSAPQEALLSNFSAISLTEPDDTLNAPSQLALDEVLQCQISLCATGYRNLTLNSNGSLTENANLSSSLLIVNRSIEAGKSLLNLSSTDPDLIPKNFSINEADYRSIGAYLAQMFTTGYSSDGTVDRSGVQASGQIVLGDQISTPAIGRALSESPNVTDTMVKMAASITETIRNDLNRTWDNGTPTDPSTIVKVAWGWLAWPIALQILTLILLLITARITRSSLPKTGRTPDLSLLVHSLEGIDTAELKLQYQHLEESIMHIRAHLDGSRSTPRLVVDKGNE